MTNVLCVHAAFGTYTKQFVEGGRQLVHPLIEHWSDIPPEFRERLGLKPGLVRT